MLDGTTIQQYRVRSTRAVSVLQAQQSDLGSRFNNSDDKKKSSQDVLEIHRLYKLLYEYVYTRNKLPAVYTCTIYDYNTSNTAAGTRTK